jgi:outer membrane protein TolC
MMAIRVVIIILLFLSATLAQARAEEFFSWQDCLSEAKKNNPDLIYAVEGISEKKASKSITASALYPQIDANLDASTAKTSTTSAGNTTISTQDSYSYGLDGSQLIFDGLKTIHDVKAAAENVKAAQENYRFTSSDVRLNLRSAFVDLLRAQELIDVEEDILKIRRDNLMLITLRYESGLEHKGAMLTAEANLIDADSKLAQAKRDLEFSQRQLNKEMGRKEFKPMYVKGDFIVRDNAKEKPVFEEIAGKHPSVLKAAAQKNSAAFSVKSAYGNFFPGLTGTAGLDKSGSHWPPGGDGYNLGLGLNMPPFP